MKVFNIYFIFDVTCVLIYNYAVFLINKDYARLIKNIAFHLSKKNMLYVKLFQAISLNNNLIDDTVNTELVKYTDSVPYSDDDIENLEELSKQFSLDPFTKPINSGMISLVYKTRMGDKTIILKVKRKNIDEKFDDAIEKMMFFIHLLSFIPKINFLDIPSIVKKNIILLRDQLDFNKEVENTKEMKKNYENLKYIKIPDVYENVTKMYPNVIMMEFIEGQHITKISDDDYNEYAKLVIKYGFVSVINNNVTHGDLHAGNIIFMKNPIRLGLIDFGIVTRINKDAVDVWFNVFSNVHTLSSREITEKMLDTAIYPKELFLQIPIKEKGELIDDLVINIEETFCGINANQMQLIELFKKIKYFLSKRKPNIFYINDDLVKLQMTLAMSQGVAFHLCKNDYIPFAKKVLDELFHRDLS